MSKKFFAGECIIISLLVFFAVGQAHAAQTIRIEIPAKFYSAGNSFKLGSVAKITGGNRKTQKILSDLTINSDGNILTRNEVLRAISESSASDARIELYMPSTCQIERPAYEGNFTESPAPKSLSSLIPVIKSLSSWNGDLEISANSAVPDGQIIEPLSIIPGTQTVNLQFRDNTGKIKSFPVRLTWYQNILAASHNIKKGSRINPADLTARRVAIKKPGAYASNPSEIIGLVANKNIKQGEAILLSNLVNSNIVPKGRRVKIVARLGAASASTDGILLDEGRPGDVVRVRRADNKKIILRAKIVNENLVEIEVL